MIKQILFPTDFSKNALNALPFAIDIAKKNDAELIIMHSYEVPLTAPSNIFTTREKTMKDIGKRMRKASEVHIQELISTSNLGDISVDTIIREGSTLHEIQKVVTKKNIDLIVMGTKGETAKRELFVGSVTKNLMQSVHCPILAIPDDCKSIKLKHIIYATDLRSDETNAINYLIMFAGLFDAQLTIVHFDYDPEVRLKHTEELKEIVSKTTYPKINYEEIVVDELGSGIDNYIKNNNVDMLTITTNTTSLFDKIFHKSLSKEILFHTHKPMLLFNRKNKDIIFF